MYMTARNCNSPGTKFIPYGSSCYTKFIKFMGILQEIESSGVCQKRTEVTETAKYFSRKLILYNLGVLSQQFTCIKLFTVKN